MRKEQLGQGDHAVWPLRQKVILGTKRHDMGGVVRAADLIDVQFLGSKWGPRPKSKSINPVSAGVNEIEKRLPAWRRN